jgi:hypothetical protein
MATKLTKPIKREVSENSVLYTLTVTPDHVIITEKGCRKGITLSVPELCRNASAVRDRR